MECVDGESLAAYSKHGKRLGLPELRQLLDTLCDVLGYLHSRVPPVIHRDIKPGNIIRRPDGSFCLVDFGSVRDGLRPEGGSTVVGTFGYMAPEQFQGRAMPCTDLYAVGALLLALITGKSPDELPHKGLVLDARSAIGGAIPNAWVELITQLVNLDPDQRPASLAPLLEALDQPRPVGSHQSAPPGYRPSQPAQQREVRDPDAAFTVMVGSGLGLIPLLALTIARIALFFALGVAVPIVLYLLSVFFGARLREVASQVIRAGQQARARLAEVSGHLQRAEPFVLQGRHYRRQQRRNRADRAARHDWFEAPHDWRGQADWRKHWRFEDSSAEDDDAERGSAQSRKTRRHGR